MIRLPHATGPLLILAAVLLGPPALAAQEPPGAGGLPPEVAAEMIEFYNRRETIRMTGESRIAEGSEVVGDVAVLGGPLTVAGRIRGRVVVLNGNVRLEPGAVVDGDLTVVGGVAAGLDAAQVTGAVVSYRGALRYRVEDGQLALSPPESASELRAGRDFEFGRTDLLLATHRGYNRVEGLPIRVGLRFETRRTHPTRLEGMAIYRTESGFDADLDELGYIARAEQALDGRRALRIGATLHSEIEPIENQGLSDRENSLATFVLARDYRDHHERAGWSAYLRYSPPDRPHELALEYRDERHASVAARTPWAIFSGGDPWRFQPVVAEGTLRSVIASFRLDSRNERADPTAGWFVQASLERALGGSLHRPILADPLLDPIVEPAPVPASDEFAAGTLDIRRYARMSPSARIALRAMAAGALNNRPLPAQRQHTLGGEGTLPGYALFRFDCGAREQAGSRDGVDFYPYYGCDRVALVQIEYRSDFPFGRGWGRMLGWDIDLGETPGWVVFFDAGRAWTERESRDGRTSGQDDFAVDVGLGLRLARLGLYWALPLSGRDKGANFFIRFGSRL